MKIRDSGMPEEATWSAFFQPAEALHRLGFGPTHEDVLDLGCGYGTFSVAAARLTTGVVHALDIEADMVAATAANAERAGVANVRAARRNFVRDGTGLPDGSVAYAMLFNILHAEDPLPLLKEAFRTLRGEGTVAVMHWIHDANTPRGPSLNIRPRPEQCLEWMRAAGFVVDPQIVSLPPYHFGLIARRRNGARAG